MAWLAVDKDLSAYLYLEKPERKEIVFSSDKPYVPIRKVNIPTLIGKDLTWEDEPVKI
jgi:hypothetical protein